MCGTCGCSDPANEVVLIDAATGARKPLRQHGHDHGHDQGHSHDHGEAHHHHPGDNEPHSHGPNGEVIPLQTAVLSKNDAIAAENRRHFERCGILALNLVSSPGAGKTALLERTIQALGGRLPITVIEGDQMTTNDAERIRAAGARAIQVNTGAGCHLEADMVAEAVTALAPEPGSLLMIENVGNLVCPAMFDLGERMKVAIASTTEGEDKPLKYPHMFRAAKLVLINKIDLAAYVDFDEAACRANVAAVNPAATVLTVSAKTGEGFGAWTELLQKELGAEVVEA